MARTTSNTDLVPKEALEQLKQLDTQLDTTTKELKGLLTAANEVSNALARSTVEYRDLKELLKALDAIGKQVDGTGRKRRDIIMQIAAQQEKLIQADSKEAVELKKVNEQLREKDRINKSVARSNLVNANSLTAMRERLVRWNIAANKMDTSTAAFEKMKAAIKNLSEEISKQEASMGNYRRNVGNYSSAFNGLQFNIQQVARELPSLTISASQFFLAISNNLPMLVDELHRAREANAALKKEGQATVPVWRQVLKGIVSWQTALVVGITLLSAYGKEIVAWVKGLFQGEEALNAVAEAQKSLNEAHLEGAKNMQEEIQKLNLLRKTAEDQGLAMDDRLKAVDELQKLYPDYLGNMDRENILMGNVSGVYETLALNIERAAIARAKFNKLVEVASEAEELENIYNNLISQNADVWSSLGLNDPKLMRSYYDANKSINPFNWFTNLLGVGEMGKLKEMTRAYDEWQAKLEEMRQISKDINLEDLFNPKTGGAKNNIKDTTERLDKEREARLQYYEQVYKDYSERNKAIVEDDKLSYEQRLQALSKFTEAQITAINMSKQAQLDALPEDEDTTFQRLIIERKAQEEINKVLEERRGIQGSLLIQSQQMGLSQNIESITNEERKAQNLLKDLYLSGDIDKEEYEKRSLQTTRNYATQRFNTELEGLNEILNMEELTPEQRAKIEEEYGKAEREYQKWLLSQENADYDKAMKEKEEMDKLYAQKKQELLQGVFDFATGLLERDLENQLEQLERESEENEKWAEDEAARIDRLEESGAISKEQADARKAAVDDQAEARERQIEERQRELQRKQAQYQKAESLMQIAFNTAVAIMAAWKNPLAAPALIPTIIAAGVAQAAAVAATPIPEYAEGTEDHPGGLAIVGDGGKSEMIISGGKVYKTPAVDTLVDLPRHAVVLPDFGAAAERLPEMPQVNSVVNVDNSKLEALSKENGKLLRQLIRRMEINAKNEIYARELERLRPTKRRSK